MEETTMKDRLKDMTNEQVVSVHKFLNKTLQDFLSGPRRERTNGYIKETTAELKSRGVETSNL